MLNASRLVIIIFYLLFVIPAQAAVFNVNSINDEVDLNPGDGICESNISHLCTLRAAVMEANALPGKDDILIANGTYDLSLVGAEDDTAEFGDLDVTDSVLITSQPPLSKRDLDYTHLVTISAADIFERVFHILGDITVTIANVHITNGNSDFGGAIYNESNLTLSAVTVSNSGAAESGGGLYDVRGVFSPVTKSLNIISSVFQSNQAAQGAGVYAESYDSVVNIDGSKIQDNQASRHGGGLMAVDYSNLGTSIECIINSSLIQRNVISSLDPGGNWGAGIHYVAPGSLQITFSQVLENRIETMYEDLFAEDRFLGAGIYFHGWDHTGNLSIQNTTINSNQVVHNLSLPGSRVYGIGVLAEMASSAIIERNDIALNSNSSSIYLPDFVAGGGLTCLDADLEISETEIHDNRIATSGQGTGGGVHLSSRDHIIQDSDIYDNAIEGGTGAFIAGAGIYSSYGNGIEVLNSSIERNTLQALAGHDPADITGIGAGIKILSGSYHTLTSTTVRDNQNLVAGGGGGVHIYDANVLVQRSTVSGNYSLGDGGGLFQDDGGGSQSVEIINSTVSENTADGQGGGIYQGGGFTQLSNVTLVNNVSNSEGGGIYVSADAAENLEAKNSLIASNVSLTTPANDCRSDSALYAIQSYGYNILGDITGCDYLDSFGDQVGDRFGAGLIFPRTNPLANYGGPTETHSLKPISPAVDAGNPTGCTDFSGAPLLVDQRGFFRSSGDCDIGAVEL